MGVLSRLGWTADRATDGKTNTVYGSRTCTHTQEQDTPWIRVDLGKPYAVSTIKLHNYDCCNDRSSSRNMTYSCGLTDLLTEDVAFDCLTSCCLTHAPIIKNHSTHLRFLICRSNVYEVRVSNDNYFWTAKSDIFSQCGGQHK